jgi:hypothetical protein
MIEAYGLIDWTKHISKHLQEPHDWKVASNHHVENGHYICNEIKIIHYNHKKA